MILDLESRDALQSESFEAGPSKLKSLTVNSSAPGPCNT